MPGGLDHIFQGSFPQQKGFQRTLVELWGKGRLRSLHGSNTNHKGKERGTHSFLQLMCAGWQCSYNTALLLLTERSTLLYSLKFGLFYAISQEQRSYKTDFLNSSMQIINS